MARGCHAPDEAKAIAAADRVSREFDRLESLLSVWKDGSDVVPAQRGGRPAPVEVSREMRAEVLTAARKASEWTGGKFDITFGALADIWKFDHDQDNVVPSREAIATRVPLVDYQAVQVDRQAKARRSSRGPACAFTSVASAKAMRSIAPSTLLRRDGFDNFLLQSGGDMYVAGTNNGTPWTLGIADPRGAHEAFAAVAAPRSRRSAPQATTNGSS